METAVAEKPQKVIRKNIAKIVPFLNGKSQYMGLAAHGEVVLPGANHKTPIICLEKNGVKRYLSGLDEFAPEVQNISDPDEKKRVVRSIREKVIYLEQSFGANVIKIDDPEFWSKVQTVHPKNSVFWDEVFISPGNEPVFLDPNDPMGLVIITAIEAGGFPIISKSYEDARLSPIVKRWYLDREIDTASTKTEVKKIKNAALANLQVLFNDPKKLLYVTKCLDARSDRYKIATSLDVMYEWLDNYLNGQGLEKTLKRAAENFNKAFKMDLAELRIRAVVSDAAFYKIIQTRADGKIYAKNGTMVGGNIEEVVKYLTEPVNAKTWEAIFEEVDGHWKN